MKEERAVLVYARVSSFTQKDYFVRQIELLKQNRVREVITDIASGLNEKRSVKGNRMVSRKD